jgi:hypothetical protein
MNEKKEYEKTIRAEINKQGANKNDLDIIEQGKTIVEF